MNPRFVLKVWLCGAALLTAACHHSSPTAVTPVQQYGVDLAKIGERIWAPELPAVTFVTLTYRDGHFEGSSGCNLYTATVQLRGTAGDVTVNPTLATHRACVPAVMTHEKLFLDRLRTVTSMRVTEWDVWLAYDRGPDKGNLQFSPYEPSVFSIYRNY